MFPPDLWSQLLSSKPEIFSKAEEELSGYDKNTLIKYLKAFYRSVSEKEANDFGKLKELLLKRIRHMRKFMLEAALRGKKYTAADFIPYINWKAFSGDESNRPNYPIESTGKLWYNTISNPDVDLKDFFKPFDVEKEERERKEKEERERKEKEERERKEKERKEKERKEKEDRERKEKERKEKEEREREEREKERNIRRQQEEEERKQEKKKTRMQRKQKEAKKEEIKQEEAKKADEKKAKADEKKAKADEKKAKADDKKAKADDKKKVKEEDDEEDESKEDEEEEAGLYDGDKVKTDASISQIKYKHPFYRGYVDKEPPKYDTSSKRQCIDDSKTPLMEHQKLAVTKLQNTRGLLLIHSVGSGKTLSAVTAAKCYLDKNPNNKVYFVAPKSLVLNFAKELDTYGPALTSADKAKIIVLTYTEFKKKIETQPTENVCKNSMLIVDEAHNIRTVGTQAVDAMMKCTQAADKVLLLSATPVINSPFDILVMMSYINPTIQPIIKKLKSKDFSFDALTPDDYKKIFGCQVSFYDPSPEQLAEYPRTNLIERYLKMTPEYYAKYKQIEGNSPDLLVDEKLKKIYASGSDITRFYNGVRRATNDLEGINGTKFQYLNALLQNTILKDDHSKLVIYTFWDDAGSKLLEEILKKHKIEYSIISGKTTKAQRGQIVIRYNADVIGKPVTDKKPIRVLIISKAGGEGLDLHQTTDIVVVEPYWNESLMKQVVGRAIRYKSHQFLPPHKRVVNVHKLYLLKPQEHDIIVKNENKADASLFEKRMDLLPLSIDIYLKFLSNKKQSILDMFLKEIRKYAIETDYCKNLPPPF